MHAVSVLCELVTHFLGSLQMHGNDRGGRKLNTGWDMTTSRTSDRKDGRARDISIWTGMSSDPPLGYEVYKTKFIHFFVNGSYESVHLYISTHKHDDRVSVKLSLHFWTTILLVPVKKKAGAKFPYPCRLMTCSIP